MPYADIVLLWLSIAVGSLIACRVSDWLRGAR